MKIDRMDVDVLEVPLPVPLRTRLIEITSAYLVLVRLGTDDGCEGVGFGAVLQHEYAKPLATLIDGMRPALIGADPAMPEAVRVALDRSLHKAGPGGMATWAVSAIETAVWDCFGRAVGQPLYRLLGGYRTTLPTYAILGLNHRDEAELFDQIDEVVAQGFKALKVFVGGLMGSGESMRDIAAALGRVREHLPAHVGLALDNQDRFKPYDAIALGRMVEDLDLFWFEEPVDHRDLAALAQVSEALTTPVCSGEQLFGIQAFRDLIRSGAADIVMVDQRMVGGISPFRKVAALTEAWNMPVVSHMMTAIDIHVMASVPNAGPAEYVPWSDAIFDPPITLRDGELVVPEAPGLGCELIPGIVEKLRA